MKLLLDACVWGKAADALRTLGHDVDWAGDWPEDPGDEEILNRAHREARILITLDKDFGELAVLKGQPHSWDHPPCQLLNQRTGSDLRSRPGSSQQRTTIRRLGDSRAGQVANPTANTISDFSLSRDDHAHRFHGHARIRRTVFAAIA